MRPPSATHKALARRATVAWLCCVANLSALACQDDVSRTREAPTSASHEAPSLHSLTVKRLDGSTLALSTLSGKVLLVLNTASECGYTPQYAGLQALQDKYASRGFAVLGFPSNDFGGQEPGSADQIAHFCHTNFGVTFPMFEKGAVTGSARSPVYALLARAQGEPKWNFHKQLVDKRGRPVQAWPSSVEPSSPQVARAIERELARPPSAAQP